jgi:hypothetical protein
MARQEMKLSSEPARFTLNFGGAASAAVDLSRVKMTDRQKQIVDKLLMAQPSMTLEECTGDDCPAQKHLSSEEFREIRGLKATLGGGGAVAGLVCDFCLKCVNV